MATAVVFSGGCGRENGRPQRPPFADLRDRTTWDSCFIAGQKVGYSKTTVSHEKRDGRTIVKIESISRLAMQRFGEHTEMSIELVNLQTSEGRLIGFESRVSAGETPLATKGRVEGGRLVIDVSSKGMTRTESIPWCDDYAGMFGVEQMLLGSPMKPGRRRSVRMLMPIVNEVAVTNLAARDYEWLKLPSGTRRLLRIDTETILSDGQKLLGTIWTDGNGDTLKTYSRAADQELIRTTESDALDTTGMGKIDLGADMKIPLARPLTADEINHKARYRVHIQGQDPASVLVESASQKVESLGPETALVTVYALQPNDDNRNPQAPPDRPDREDLAPGNIVQSDNAKIVAMAALATGKLEDAWQTAVALERYVHEHITKKDFSTAFATAAEVVESLQGDCSEHAVLLAALARARGIPARAAVGLVYLPEDQAFFYHMWTEVYIENRWIPLDATMGGGGVGAERLVLTHSNLKGVSAFGCFLPVAQVMGRMKIEPLGKKNGKTDKAAK